MADSSENAALEARKSSEEGPRQLGEFASRFEALLPKRQRRGQTGTFSFRLDDEQMLGSSQLYRIFELDPALPLSLPLVEARIHPDDLPVFKDSLAGARRVRSDFEHELRLQIPNQSVKYLRVVAQPTHGSGGSEQYVGAIEDVTEQLVARQALARVQSELAHVNRIMSLGVLTASIAHEINQPLSSVVTSASTCLRMLASDAPNLEGARETARRTIQFGNRVAEVTKRLRALFSHSGVAAEAVDLNEAVADVLALSLHDLRQNRVQVRQELASDLPLVTSDRVQLQQVVLNLVLNASEAMSGVEDRARELAVRTESVEGARVRLSVRDTGAGFDPRCVEQLFEAFYTTKKSGMGIGLSVSRFIVESHGGRLWAESNDGPGATFSLELPGATGRDG